MNIDGLTIGQAREISAMFSGAELNLVNALESPLINHYVIVRCCDAGVHAGVLLRRSGRECFLQSSRRLWYWKPANGAAFLSGVAAYGLDSSSKVGEPVDILLTENCEIIDCTLTAQESIIDAPSYAPR